MAALRLIARSRYHRLAGYVGLFLLIALVLYAERVSVLRWIGHQLVRSDSIQPSDAIVVLAGINGERELEAADLYAAKAAPLVVLTTEQEPKTIPELRRRGVRVERTVERERRYLTELGVPPSAIIVLADPVQSTEDEAMRVAEWSRTHRVRSLIVVTSWYHTRRAGRVFEWALRGLGVVVRVRPVTFTLNDADHWWMDRDALRASLFEWQKVIFYRLRYW